MTDRHPSGPKETADPSRSHVQPEALLQQVAAELADLAEALDQFQHDLSDLLVEAHVSPALLRRVQTIDATTQALHALSGVTHALGSGTIGGAGIALADLQDLVPLGQLRCRLSGCGTVGERTAEDGQVSLF